MADFARALTTHVLDTAQGRPARGVEVVVARGEDGGWRELVRVRTNEDGRTDRPLLDGAELAPGRYELTFGVGAYFEAEGIEQQRPPFLGAVPVRLSVAAEHPRYHVPLLCSPWSYSTYLGS